MKPKPVKAKAQKPAKAPDFRICPNCQTRNKAKWEICARCGESLEGVPLGLPPGMAAAAAAPAAVSDGSGVWPLLTGLGAVVLIGAGIFFLVNQPKPPDRPDPDIFVMPKAVPPVPAPTVEPPEKDDGAARYYTEGRRKMASGDFAGAVQSLREAVSRASERAEYRYAFGQALVGAGDRDSGIAEMEAAVQLAPLPGYLTGLGRALADAGRVDEGLRALQRALDQSPDDVGALRGMASLLAKSQRHADAATQLKKLRDLQPNDPVLAQETALQLEKAGQRDEAIAVYRAIVEQVPDAAITRGLLAESLLKAGRPDEAVATFKQGLERSPDNAILHRGLGSILERTGNVEGAIEAYRAYARLAPNAADAKDLEARAAKLEKQVGRGQAGSSTTGELRTADQRASS